MSRSRNWCFRINRTDENWETTPKHGDTMLYICWAPETGEGGLRHWQGAVVFKNPATLQQTKNRIWIDPAIHVEIMQGTIKQAADYCKKGTGDKDKPETWDQEHFEEHGEQPAHKPGSRTDLEKARELIKEGVRWQEVAVEHCPAVGARASKWLQLVAQEQSKPRDWETNVMILWGDAGTGKTRYAIEHGAKQVTYTKSDFIVGYEGGEVVVFDDIPLNELPPSVWKKLTDRYPMEVNIKNGSANWGVKHIIFTMNQEPNIEDEAYERRINSVIHMYHEADGGIGFHVKHPVNDFRVRHGKEPYPPEYFQQLEPASTVDP